MGRERRTLGVKNIKEKHKSFTVFERVFF